MKRYKQQYKWNSLFKLIMDIKHAYQNQSNIKDCFDFDTWVKYLDNSLINSILENLVITQTQNVIMVRLNFNNMFETNGLLWNIAPYKQSRSVTIDIENDEILTYPFTKFFNIDENYMTKLENIQNMIKYTSDITITDKLDGSMQTARYLDDKDTIFMTGSQSTSLSIKDSWRLQSGWKMIHDDDNYIHMIKQFPNYTFVFEHISEEDVHIVDYDKKDYGMYLIGITNMVTGQEYSYKSIISLAQAFNVKHVKIEDISFEELWKYKASIKANDKEGWVVDINGYKFKCKGDEFIDIHNVMNLDALPKLIIKSINDNTIDDVRAKAPKSYLNVFDKTCKEVMDFINKKESKILKLYHNSPRHLDTVEYMKWVSKNCDKQYQFFLRCKYNLIPYSLLCNTSGKMTTIKQIRESEFHE